ncbi:Sodium/hydrogen exchanger family-domain-containing protein [Amylostereum chailletii]|nr:Sodium/hydrogen exchanger family-domain-containing protein [Amylostereum chailletii]
MVHFDPFEVSTPHIVYACLGGFVVFFGMFSLFIREKLYIGEACWAFLFGVIIGACRLPLPGHLRSRAPARSPSDCKLRDRLLSVPARRPQRSLSDSGSIRTSSWLLVRAHAPVLLPCTFADRTSRRPGPYCANIFDPRSWGNGDEDVTNTITLEFSRVVLAIGVFAIGVELPKAYMQRHWKSLFFLLGPIMTWGWFVSAAFIYALIPNLSFLASLAVAACLTPTDPILAAAVVGGKYADKHVPAHLRHLLAAESGCNDGAAFPFLFIALYLILDRTTGEAVKDWFLILWLYEVVLGIVFGAALGFGFRHLMKFCERKDLIDRQSYVAQYVSLALLTIGSCTLLGTDDLLAAFSCGTAFAWDGFFNKRTEEAVFSSVIDLLFNVAAFVFVGAWTPFTDFHAPELSITVWRLVVIAILVLLFRRLPIMFALYKWIPDVKNWREALFSGHFGPMGVGAIFISTLAAEMLPKPQNPPQGEAEILAASIQPIVAFMVVVSIVIHGLSIPFFSLGRRVRTVTRTWSRQPSLPDWAMHTRPVVRGEDIVINRDHPAAMERGEAGYDEKVVDRTTAAHGPAREKIVTKQPSDSDQSRTPAGTPDDKEAEHGELHGGNPPDGDTLLAEWKEGPHKVIERRAGPGEEVEVEVQRNFYGPDDAERITHAFRGATHLNVHQAAEAFLGGMGHAPHAAEHPLHAVEATAKGAEKAVAGAAKHAVEAVERAASPSAPRRGADEDEGEGEGEGWASDRSDEGRRRRSKEKKKKPIVIVHGRPGRRRFSHLRSTRPAPPPPTQRSAGPSAPDAADTSALDTESIAPASDTDAPVSSSPEDEPRGRSPPASASASASASAPAPAPAPAPVSAGPRRPTHWRVDSLRASHHEMRDASPSRSIRWADPPLSPRLSASNSAAASDEDEDEQQPEETARPSTRVSFDTGRGRI